MILFNRMEYLLINAVPEDEDWVNNLTVKTMKPWVEAAWKEEADRQHYYYLNRFDLKTTQIITVDGRKAGRISSSENETTFELSDIHLEENFHGSGLGTKIINDTIAYAFSRGLTVELKCLRTNPVQNLYLRLGFSLIKEDEKRLYYRIKRPVILLTNDDGIRSPGIIAAAETLAEIGELWVAAPHMQQTSAGRSHPPSSSGITTKADGFPSAAGAFAIEGSPSQCVDHAILEIMPRCPDIVVSGINSGVNVGVDITRSGTIGAAIEGASYGIPAIAVSLEIHHNEIFSAEPQADFSTAGYFTAKFAQLILTGAQYKDIDLLKIEVPDNAEADTAWEVTKLYRKTYYHVEKPQRSSLEKKGQLLWRLETDLSKFDEGTDAHTVFVKRQVSVTPISMDMTSRIELNDLKDLLDF